MEKIYKVAVSENKKEIVEYNVIEEFDTHFVAVNDSLFSCTVDKLFFTEPITGEIDKDSFTQFTHTLVDADHLAMRLLDRIVDAKYYRYREIKRQMDATIKTRNSPPIIRRVENV